MSAGQLANGIVTVLFFVWLLWGLCLLIIYIRRNK